MTTQAVFGGIPKTACFLCVCRLGTQEGNPCRPAREKSGLVGRIAAAGVAGHLRALRADCAADAPGKQRRRQQHQQRTAMAGKQQSKAGQRQNAQTTCAERQPVGSASAASAVDSVLLAIEAQTLPFGEILIQSRRMLLAARGIRSIYVSGQAENIPLSIDFFEAEKIVENLLQSVSFIAYFVFSCQ